MTDNAIQKLREAGEAATPRPWRRSFYPSGTVRVDMPCDWSAKMDDRPDHHGAWIGGRPGIAKTLRGADGEEVVVGVSGYELDGISEREYQRRRLLTADFISTARNVWPELINVAEAAASLVDGVGPNRAIRDALRDLRAAVSRECGGE